MNYQFITTADGSPTLQWQESADLAEKMHHSQGALSESLYIYLPVVESVAQGGWPLKFMSLGLGLGYNEMIVAAWLKQQERRGQRPWLQRLDSFESQELLKNQLLNWLGLRPKSDGIAAEPVDKPQFAAFCQAYDSISKELSQHFSLEEGELKQTLVEWLHLGVWRLKGAYSPFSHERADGGYSGIFYDAFSSKMSPELWSEEGLLQTFHRLAEPNCALATYAATGNLKRALNQSGFTVDLRPGFAGKRQCTFAIRSCQPQG